MTSIPTPRNDRRCWCNCGRFASPVDISRLTAVEHSRLKVRVGLPLACPSHRSVVQAELARHARNYRERDKAVISAGTPSAIQAALEANEAIEGMGVPLTVAFRSTLVRDLRAGLINEDRRVNAWRLVAELDRRIDVCEDAR